MDVTPEAFAYRCLPLNIANAHGWEILRPCGFEAAWDGGMEGPKDAIAPKLVQISADPALDERFAAWSRERDAFHERQRSLAPKLAQIERHVFSDLPSLEGPIDAKRFPRLAGARLAEVILNPGEILFMPVAWWHQVTSLDFSVTITYTNFRWPNDASQTYPQD